MGEQTNRSPETLAPPYPNVKPDSALKEPSGKRALKRH